ncbi:MAG TPA: ribonuclease T [Devosiaceae bacterium]|nr:ribonuclease T [Devosiaceae bacterium]
MRVLRSIGWVALALAAAILPAQADVPVSGKFLAAAACPALQSFNRGTNPGNVTLVPNQSYDVVSANNTPASHYLVLVPGAKPERRWVPLDCGLLEGGGAEPSTIGTVAPTHYVLALSWEPGFCVGHGDKPECRAETPTSFAASHFALHGLWPDPREYCGAAPAEVAADKASRWDELPAVPLSDTTRARLSLAMPGTQSLLERHEWIKHGTCSTLSADTYFSRAVSFLDAVNASPVQALLAESVGGDISLDGLRAAFDKAFGPGAGQRIRVSCLRQNGVRNLTEVTIGLQGDVSSTPLPQLIAAARPTNGGCDIATVPGVK